MTDRIILASGSEIRQTLLTNAGVKFETSIARIDEDAVRASLQAEGATPRDIADALAESKARKISLKQPDALVIGCDQILDFNGAVFSKPRDRADALDQLKQLSANRHSLLSAAVIYQDGKPLWRHVGVVRLYMRDISTSYLNEYIDRNWETIRHTVGCYMLEGEGVRLFSRVDGDYFSVLGLPLLPLLNYLTLRGVLNG